MNDAIGVSPAVGLTFALAGFSKCGTTTLSAALGEHPDVLLPEIKEPWFFSHAVLPDAWPEYEAQFPRWRDYAAVGDDSTTYTAYQCVEQASSRLAHFYPDLRVLLIARDPVDRIESAFREMQHSSHLFGLPSPSSLDEALDTQPQLLADSCFFAQSQPYRARFPTDHIKVVFLEDLRDSPRLVVQDCLTFLGVDPDALPESTAPVRLNAGETKYRDSALLQRMRYHRLTRRAVAWRGNQNQERFFRAVGLRRRARPVAWTDAARQRVRQTVAPDAHEFLAMYSPGRVWPRLEQLCNE